MYMNLNAFRLRYPVTNTPYQVLTSFSCIASSSATRCSYHSRLLYFFLRGIGVSTGQWHICQPGRSVEPGSYFIGMHTHFPGDLFRNQEIQTGPLQQCKSFPPLPCYLRPCSQTSDVFIHHLFSFLLQYGINDWPLPLIWMFVILWVTANSFHTSLPITGLLFLPQVPCSYWRGRHAYLVGGRWGDQPFWSLRGLPVVGIVFGVTDDDPFAGKNKVLASYPGRWKRPRYEAKLDARFTSFGTVVSLKIQLNRFSILNFQNEILE